MVPEIGEKQCHLSADKQNMTMYIIYRDQQQQPNVYISLIDY